MKSSSQKIPDYLVYEIYNGKPIHYKEYRDVLKGTKTFEEITGSSFIQSFIITELIILLGSKISSDFQLLSSEIGIKFDKNARRSADIAIYEKARLKNIEDENKILNIPPKYVIEVDIKAAKEDIEDSTSYYYNKTDELLGFGVEYVFWIFTSTKKVMCAQKGMKNWVIGSWNDTPIKIEGIEINIEEIVDKK